MSRFVAGIFMGGYFLAMVSTSATAQHAREQSPQDVFHRILPAVVSIVAVSIDPFSLSERVHTVAGSGIVIDDLGRVLTNSHIVFGSSSITVLTSKNQVMVAELVGADPVLDLAVLRPAVSRIRSGRGEVRGFCGP